MVLCFSPFCSSVLHYEVTGQYNGAMNEPIIRDWPGIIADNKKLIAEIRGKIRSKHENIPKELHDDLETIMLVAENSLGQLALIYRDYYTQNMQ